MGVTALVMAGGRGLRLGIPEEKPMIKVGGKPMIQRVVEALKSASKVEDIVVAVTEHTPKTAAFVRGMSIKVLQTPGEGFCSDVKYAVKTLNLGVVLVIGADLPLISSDIIDMIITHYEQCRKPALTVMAPLEIYTRLGLSVSYIFEINGKKLVPLCINMIDGRMINEEKLDEEILVIEDEKAIVNVNTLNDLKIAKHICAAFPSSNS
jgi:adenosylcobinamide-phosphate guanylyltransferase